MRVSLRYWVFVIALSLSLMGCASPAKRYAQAVKLEEQGNVAAAYAMYEQLAASPGSLPGGGKTVADLHFRMADCLWRMGRTYEAFQMFQRVVAAAPEHLTARSRLATLYLAGGSAEAALEQVNFILQMNPNDAEALSIAGAIYSAAGIFHKAEQALSRSFDLDPARSGVALALADLYNRQDRIAAARQVLNRAAEATPKSSVPLLALARLEEQQGDTAAAERAYRLAVAAEDSVDSNLRLAQFLQRHARIAEAEKILRRVDTLQPDKPSSVADFHLLAGSPSKALRSYLTGARVEDRSQQNHASAINAARIITADLEAGATETSVLPTTAARQHLNQYRNVLDEVTVALFEAEIALREHQFQAARDKAQRAVELAPGSPAAHYLLGIALHELGDAAGAKSAWQTALERDAGYAPVRLLVAKTALAAGDLSAAEHYVSGVVRDEPANFRALILFARVLLTQKRWNDARGIAQRAMAVDANAVEPHLLLGEADLGQQRPGSALVHFQRALLHDPHSAAAMQGLLRVYRFGTVTRAMLQGMEKVAEAPPVSATLMELVGRLYAEKGWMHDSQRALRRAIEMDQQRATAATALGKAYVAQGRLDAAHNAIARASSSAGALLAAVNSHQQADTENAIRHYELALQKGDSSGVAANNLAWLYAERGEKLDRALELARQASVADPRNPAIFDTLGVVHLKRREFNDAIAALRRAIELAKEPLAAKNTAEVGRFRAHLAAAYTAAGQPEQAAAIARITTLR